MQDFMTASFLRDFREKIWKIRIFFLCIAHTEYDIILRIMENF